MSSSTNIADIPKSLRDKKEIIALKNLLNEPHIEPLVFFVHTLREKTGKGEDIPYFDPNDGGINARCLFIFEAPGPKAVESGFVSRNNPDESAKNFFLLNKEANLPRMQTVSWNIVPWYIGVGDRRKIRSANSNDIEEGKPHLEKLISLLLMLRIIVFAGKKAQIASNFVRSHFPLLDIIEMPHPSPQFINRGPNNRNKILTVLHEIAAKLRESK